MDYTMEELIPVAAGLAEKYTAFESGSLTYEKMEQLMGAVLYCIRETEMVEAKGENLPEEFSEGGLRAGKMPARQAYEAGLARVEQKVKAALALYNELIPEFSSYGNQCLYDTVVKGLPEFFKWYDMKFEPQNTILTLDYPVQKDLSEYTGIDRIYEYIKCIREEQDFLKKFPEEEVIRLLNCYHSEYREIFENICEMVSLGREKTENAGNVRGKEEKG